jgi:hypothetical protein
MCDISGHRLEVFRTLDGGAWYHSPFLVPLVLSRQRMIIPTFSAEYFPGSIPCAFACSI